MKKELFILGDSISIAYTPFLRKMLSESWIISRKGDYQTAPILGEPDSANGGDSRMVRSYLCENLANICAEVVLLNCGLHDIKHGPQRTSGLQVPLDQYTQNLCEMIEQIQQSKKKIVWVTTTPVDDAQHEKHESTFFRFDSDVRTYNQKADEIMVAYESPQVDLGAFTRSLHGELYVDHVHYFEEISEKQAAFIADELMRLEREGIL